MPIKQDLARVESYALPSRKQLLFVKPRVLDEKDAVVRKTRAIFNTVLNVFETEEQASQDKWLSDLARARKVAPKVEVALTAIKAHRVFLTDCKKVNDAIEAGLFAIPQLDPTNAVAAINEREVRDHFHGLHPDERAKVMSEIGAGKHEGMLLALARSPVPDAVEVRSAQAIFRARVERENADKLRSIQRTREDLEAYFATTQSCEQHVSEAAQRVATQTRDAA